MTKRIAAKHKIDRRLGVNLWGRAKSPFAKSPRGPGQHGTSRSKMSDFGIQLRAKQKLKGYYANITESQFSRYYEKSARKKGDSGENLINLLEHRLDSIVYRAKLVPTMFAARQFVSHGHLQINGKRITIPSYLGKNGEVIEVRQRSQKLDIIEIAQKLSERDVPDYIAFDPKKMTVQINRDVRLEEVPYPVEMEPHLIIEYYSR
ncbi:MAG: 30S ribosomal protein S4 [Alphaproteobacteria bacterium]|nr:30S ribosomal protein S4 [Alphaproteobacteria bacterium]